MLPQTKQIARYLNSLKTSSRMLAFYASCALGFTSQSAEAQEVQVSLSHQYGTTLLSPYNGTITATAPVGFNAIFENIPPLGANVGELRYSFRARYQLEPDLVESSRTLLEKSALVQLSVEPLGNLSAAREMQSISRELASLGFDMRRPDNAYWNDFIFHAPQLYRLHQTADNLLQNSLSDMHLEELASEAKAALSSEAAPAENSLLSYLVESSQLPLDTNQFGAEDILLAFYDVALHRLENGSAYQREWLIRSRPHGPNNLLPNSLALLNENGIVQIILPRIRCLLPEYHAVGYEINAVRAVGISCHSHIERSSAFRSLKVFGNYWQYKIDTGRYSFRDRVFLSTIAAARYRSIEVDEVSFAADGLGLEPSTTEQLFQSLSRSVVTGFGFLSSMGRPFSRNALGLYGASSVVDEPTYDLIAALLVNEAELAYDQLLQAEAAATLANCLPIGCNYAVLPRAGNPDELFKLFNPSIQRLLNVDAAWFQDFRKDTPRIKEIIEIAQSVVWASYTWERHSGFLPVVDNSSRQIRQAYMRGISSWVINEMRPGHRYQGSLLHVSEQPSVLALENAGTSNISSYVKFNPGFVAEVFGVDPEDASDGLTIFGETPRSIRFQMRSINNAIHDGALSVANSLTRTAGLFSYGQLPNAIIDAEDIVRIYRSEIEPSTDRLADSLIDFQLLTAGDQAYLQSGNLHPEDEAQVVRHVIASEGSRLSVGDPILEYRPLFTYRTNINVDEIPMNIANAASGAIATATLRCKGPIQVAEAQEGQWQQPLPHSDLKDRVFSIGELSLPVLITVDRLRQVGQFDTAIGDPSTISLIVHIQYENRFFYDGTRRLRIVQSLVAEELTCSLFFN